MAFTYDQMSATTEKYYLTAIQQQAYDSNMLLDRIKSGKRVKVVTGGRTVAKSIRHDTLGMAKWIDPDDSRTTSHKETRTLAELDWKFSVIDLIMTWEEKSENRGEAAFVNLLADKITEGMDDFKSKWSTVLYQAYASKGSDDPDGLYSICQTTSSASTYAGISSDDASNWVAGLYDSSTTALALYGSGSLNASIQACTFINPPNLIVTTRAVAGYYASKLQPSERRAPENGRSGATDLAFQGIPIIQDPQCLAGDIFYINTDHLWLYVQSGYNFQVGKWEVDPGRYHADRCLISFQGNLITDLRKAHGAQSAIAS